MRPPRFHVAHPPEKPLLVFDGDCGFCRYWISRWEKVFADRVDRAPYQEVAGRFPEVPVEAFQSAVRLIESDGTVFGGAEAVFRARALNAGRRRLRAAYEHLPGFSSITESAYRLIASHRNAAAAVTRFFWGQEPAASEFTISERLFPRLIGLVYFLAIGSLALQAGGLIGTRGISPVARYLGWISENFAASKYLLAPTLLWIQPSDAFLNILLAAGLLLSVLVALEILPSVSLALLWAIYLSLSVAGQEFLGFQWDSLLLEAGFLAIFFRVSPRLFRALSAWLLFRLMFSSGFVKLASADPAWRGLTALQFHYETQPLPTFLGWYAHQLPASIQQACAAAMFIVELAAPFFFFAPRRLRHAAAFTTIAFELAIAATGNYAFFNLLTIGLCLLLLDDRALRRLGRFARSGKRRRPAGRIARRSTIAVGAIVAFLSAIEMTSLLFPGLPLPAAAKAAYRFAEPFRSVNRYGLFAVMTTTRPEIDVQGSEDGADWKSYGFRWKAGDPARRPAYVSPHQPRLDWQMWFAALGSYRENAWFIAFERRLLEGEPAVLNLLALNPFPAHPPRYIRAVLFDYRFTTIAEKGKTGMWWKRKELGLYCPPISLEDFASPQAAQE